MEPKEAKAGRMSRIRTFAANCGVAALVSIFVSGGVSGFIGYKFAAKLENDKEKVASLVRYKDQVDSSQNAIISQLGIYTDRLFKDKSNAKLEDLQQSIITAQLQINRLRDQVRLEDQPILTEYESELGNLLKNLRSVSAPNDLGPALASAQKILSIHDRFSERVRDNIKAIF